MGKKKLRTPLIKPRSQGGTFYTFVSALEDVGLNINELKNKVSLSHYVLLNIPAFDSSISYPNTLDINAGDYIFAQDMQSYVLNMETVLRNQKSYNFADALTVSERVFWKYLEKTGVVNFVDDVDEDGKPTGYFVDANNCVQAFGAISSGAQRSDSYGLYNETFVQVPSSYGKMKVLFKNVDDRNFYIHKFYTDSSSDLIEYITEDEVEDASLGNYNLHTGLSAKAIYDGLDNGVGYYEVDEDSHRACVEFSLSELRAYYDDDSLTYDDIAISHSINTAIDSSAYTLDSSTDSLTDASIYTTDSSYDSSSYYEFNAVLVYYSVYDSTRKNILATNAYGILILDNAVSEGENMYKFPSLIKKKSTLDDTGNSYAFRLNIKTTSVYNGDIIVTDNSTPAYMMSEDFNDTIRNLADAVEILRSNANLISVLASDNKSIKTIAMQSLDKLEDIEKTVKTLKSGYVKALTARTVKTDYLETNTLDSSTIFADSSTGNAVGSLSGDTLSYDNIVAKKSMTAESASIKKLNVNKFSIDEDDLIIGNTDGEGNEYAKINSNGIYANGSLYIGDDSDSTDEEEEVKELIDSALVKAVVKNMKIYADGTIKIPSEDELESGTLLVAAESTAGTMTQQQTKKLQKAADNLYHVLVEQDEEGGDSYVNVGVLVACVLKHLTDVSTKVDEYVRMLKDYMSRT